MRTTVELVTPERATELLLLNRDNRALRLKEVDVLASQMTKGLFRETGQTIQVSATNRLLDGQHRLTAIVKSGIAFTMVIVWDLPDEVFAVIDTGRKRTAADVLEIGKIENAGRVAALARMILNYQSGNVGGALNEGRKAGSTATNQQILTYVQEHDLSPACGFASRIYERCRFLSPAEWGMLYWLFAAISEEDATFYLNKLAYGVNLEENSHILYVRNRLLQNQASTTAKLSGKAKFILIIKSWNWFRTGKTTGIVQIKNEEPLPKPV